MALPAAMDGCYVIYIYISYMYVEIYNHVRICLYMYSAHEHACQTCFVVSIVCLHIEIYIYEYVCLNVYVPVCLDK